VVTRSIGYTRADGGVLIKENSQAIEGYADSGTMLEAAGLNWEVETSPLYLRNGVKFPGRVGLYRSDNGEALGIVSKSRYTVTPPSKLFAIGDAVASLDAGARWSTAGVVNRGGLPSVWASLHISDLNIAGFDHHNLLFMSTDYNGKLTLSARPTAVRVICENTYAMALGSDAVLSIRHSATDIDNQIDQAVELLQNATERAQRFKTWAETVTQEFAGPAIEQAMENLIVGEPVRVLEDTGASGLTRTEYAAEAKAQGRIEKAQKRRARSLERYRDEFRNPEYEVGGANMLSLLNSATGWADHQGRIRKTAGATLAEARVANSMFGAGSKLKNDATRLIVEYTGRSI
jgi:phage/plasmid-like protein (TIGR03299 family)